MSPTKQRLMKATSKGYRPLHRSDVRWKKQTWPLRASKMKSVSLFSLELSLRKAKIVESRGMVASEQGKGRGGEGLKQRVVYGRRERGGRARVRPCVPVTGVEVRGGSASSPPRLRFLPPGASAGKAGPSAPAHRQRGAGRRPEKAGARTNRPEGSPEGRGLQPRPGDGQAKGAVRR